MPEWNNSHKNPPKQDQVVYYFGVNIGIWIGRYHYEEEELVVCEGRTVELCPHHFLCNDGFGVVDACDAPYWLPYDAERAKSWIPIVPKEFTKGLYDD